LIDMAKLRVLTDSEGNVLGTVRTDPIETDSGTIQSEGRPPAESRDVAAIDYRDLEVPDDLLERSPENLHMELRRRVQSGSNDAE